MLEPAVGGMRGAIAADFVLRGGRTEVDTTRVAAPLELRGPFESDGGRAYFLRNVSCGVFAGDSYDVSLTAREGAHATVAPTSATKVYAMPGGASARSAMRLRTERGATLVFMEAPLILQRDSDYAVTVEIISEPGGVVAYGEVVAFGRFARGETCAFRRYGFALSVNDVAGETRYAERYELDPRSHDVIAATGYPVLGQLVVTGTQPDETQVDRIIRCEGVYAGSDVLPNHAGWIVRIAGPSIERVADVLRVTCEAVLREPFPVARLQ